MVINYPCKNVITNYLLYNAKKCGKILWLIEVDTKTQCKSTHTQKTYLLKSFREGSIRNIEKRRKKKHSSFSMFMGSFLNDDSFWFP